MGKRKVCYELYIDGRLAVRGDIDFVASLLGCSPEKAQKIPYRKNPPSWLKLASLPVLYDFCGESLTADEIAAKYGCNKQSAISAASSTHRLHGKLIAKHDYGTFSISRDEFMEWVKEAAHGAGDNLQEAR